MSKKIAIFSPYNQVCGLATYIQFITRYFREEDFLVLAEDVPESQRIGHDQANVKRCWTQLSKDHSRLDHELKTNNIDILHLNCQFDFFDMESFGPFLAGWRSKGVKIIAHLHNTSSFSPRLQALAQVVDQIIVHSPEGILDVIANEGREELVGVLEHGVEPVQNMDYASARKQLDIPVDQVSIAVFGFIEPHKKVDEVIKAIHGLNTYGQQYHLYVLGGPHPGNRDSFRYYQHMKEYVSTNDLQNQVHFREGFLPEQEVQQYLQAADAVVVGHSSEQYEASGSLAVALGCGAAVITSSVPRFARLGNVVFRITANYPLPMALILVTQNKQLNSALRRNARSWAEKYSWWNQTQQITAIYEKLTGRRLLLKAQTTASSPHEVRISTIAPTYRVRKVLFYARPDINSQPRSDTVILENLRRGLTDLGVEADLDLELRKSPKDYDIAHLLSFRTPEITMAHAQRVAQDGLPFVVTALDYNQTSDELTQERLFIALKQYVDSGQQEETWEGRETWDERQPQSAPSLIPRTGDNSWMAHHAVFLHASGQAEKVTLLRDFPNVKRIEVIPFGGDSNQARDLGQAFISQTGLKDFVLCVAPLQRKKNQLMLLKALEQSDLSLVFVTGGTEGESDYEDCCKKFKRLAPTVFLGHLNLELLASAYQAARAHVLPSFYELPGLSSLQAAAYGKNVVVTDTGTTREYFGSSAFYCRPDNSESIVNAVSAAYYSPLMPQLSSQLASYTWKNSASRLYKIYEQVMSELLLSGRYRQDSRRGSLQEMGSSVSP